MEISADPTCAKSLLTLPCLDQFATHLRTHTLKARDFSIVNASSFIIVVSVVFVGLVLLCIATSVWYRRRVMVSYYAERQPEYWATTQDPPTRPQIWDLWVSEADKSDAPRGGEGYLLNACPLAARKIPPPEYADGEGEISDTQSASRERRRGLRLGRTILREPPATVKNVSNNQEMEVVMLISMPSASSTSVLSPSSASGEEDHTQPGGEFGGGLRSEYVIGVLQVPYREAD
ncbi:hypothetical protein BC835DRAFT_1411668 [Cytidiella melzeri]|nr:hypothetical protein BC835DRAFT_1411668 [Cytidiella melzeri]